MKENDTDTATETNQKERIRMITTSLFTCGKQSNLTFATRRNSSLNNQTACYSVLKRSYSQQTVNVIEEKSLVIND